MVEEVVSLQPVQAAPPWPRDRAEGPTMAGRSGHPEGLGLDLLQLYRRPRAQLRQIQAERCSISEHQPVSPLPHSAGERLLLSTPLIEASGPTAWIPSDPNACTSTRLIICLPFGWSHPQYWLPASVQVFVGSKTRREI